MRIKDQFQTNFWDGFPLGNRGCSHLKKLKQITSQIFLEDQSLDLFISDYRKNPIFNWNPPVHDLLQVELDKFQLVESYTQTDQTTTNNTDTGQNEYTVDVTVRSPEHSSPVNGNIRMLPARNLTDANTQTTSFDFAWIPDNVESDDSLSVENHSKHNNTNTDNDHDMYTVDVTVRSSGPITTCWWKHPGVFRPDSDWCEHTDNKLWSFSEPPHTWQYHYWQWSWHVHCRCDRPEYRSHYTCWW